MRDDLEHYDAMFYKSPDSEIPADVEDDELTHVHLGAHQQPLTIDQLQQSCPGDAAFLRFSTRLKKFFKDYLPADHIPTGCISIEIVGEQVRLSATHITLTRVNRLKF